MNASDARTLPPAAQEDLRRKAVQAVRDGKSQGEAARLFGVARPTVNKWCQQHASGGAKALASLPATHYFLSDMSQLVIQDLHASIGAKEIVKGLTLTIASGEVHAIMGPNGTGKSTLAKVIAGHPDYTLTSGDVLLDGKSILAMEADERARAGLFLAFQYPSEIPGVSIANFLRAAVQARMAEGEDLDATAYYKRLYAKMDLLKIDRKFTSRAVNEGFSGGEKKRCEILQMAMLEPKFALMDETDSGLDIDALRIVAEGVNAQRGANLGVLLITHYQRLLDYIVPDFVHVMYDGRIVKSGDKSLALELEAKGYDWVKKELVTA